MIPPYGAESWLHKLWWLVLAGIPCAIAVLFWQVRDYQTSYLAQINARQVEAKAVAEVVAQ